VPRRLAVALGVAFLVLLTGRLEAYAQATEAGGYRHLSGSVALGWLDSETTNARAGSTANPFASITFDYRDAIIDPAFISYRVRPTLGTGFQDLFGTSSPRTGAAAEADFLSKRSFPLRVFYSRFRRTTLVSTYQYLGRILSRSDDSRAGMHWRLVAPRWPKLDLSAVDSDITAQPEQVLTSGYGQHTRTLALNGSDRRWGWSLDGNVRFQRLAAERVAGSASGPVPFDSTTDLRTLDLRGQRDLGRALSIFLTGNSTRAEGGVAGGFYRQQHQTYSGRLRFEPTARFSTWFEGRLSESGLEARSADVGDAPGFVVPRTDTTNRIADVEARYEAFPGVRLLGRLEFTRSDIASTGKPARAIDFLNTVGGIAFQRRVDWADLNGTYTLTRYLRRDVGVSDSDQVGHSLDVSASVGRSSLARATVGYSLSRSTQDVRAALPFVTNSQQVRLGVEKTFGSGTTIGAHWNLTDSKYDAGDVRSAYRGHGYGGMLRVYKVHVAVDHGYGSGNSVEQAFDPLAARTDGGLPIFLAGSNNDYTRATVQWKVNATLSAHGVWRDQRQVLRSLLGSRVEQREATLQYRFRLLSVEGGYVSYRYDFGSPVFRKSLMIRAVRRFQWF